MARPLGKHTLAKLVLPLVSLLGLVLIYSFFCASSPYFASIASNWTPDGSPHRIVLPVKTEHEQEPKEDTGKKGINPERVLSATYADLPAPDLKWEKMATAPVPRLDGAAIQINNLLYVFAGYGTIDYVHSHVDIFNFTDNTWVEKFDMPKEMAHSHLGMVTDGRYIYVVTGQYGPQCRGPTAQTFVLDTKTKQWRDMPPLPVPRYAPATQLWRGRLHVMGGSKENRHTPGVEHWSIAVKDGKVLEKEWRAEIPIPRGGPHRACIVVDDKLLILGGQEGDFMAKPGSPIFKCARRNEVVYSDVYMLDDEMKWKVLPPMPKPNREVVAGGTTEKHHVTKKMVLNGELVQFNLDTLDHCLVELLHGWQDGRLPVDISCVISNHDRQPNTHVIRFLERHGIPYHSLRTTQDSKREEQMLELVQKTDFLVLARYMQVLSGNFLRSYGKDIINIHHGLLPSFKGGYPSKQAFEAGVKLIGATSHFVTEELDAGPIIEQMVDRVSHRDNLHSFVHKSESLERQCLAKAVKSYCELRVLPYEYNKTVVF